jgi:hypothetical protein
MTESPDAEQDIADYITAVIGAAQGWVCVGVGIRPYRTASGRIRFRSWVEGSVVWPNEADDVAALLLKYSGQLDCYLCPNVMTGTHRAKWTSAAPREIHADVDDGRLDLDKVRAIPGACAVGSGSPGNGHVYVLLDRPVKHHQHEQLCQAQMAYFGAADSKVSDNDVLRVPGTYNFKPTVDKLPPNPVTWQVRPSGARADPAELAALLGVELTDQPPAPKAKSPSASGGRPPAGAIFLPMQPFEVLRYPDVQWALDKVTPDRSGDTMHIVGECVRAGLTEAHARWAVMQRQDLAHRLRCRADDDVASCFGKARESLERNEYER